MEKNKVRKMCTAFLLMIAIIVTLVTVKTGVTQYHNSTTPHNEQIQLYFVDEAISIANYTDDTHEPTGWELFPSIFWDSDKNGMFEADETIGHAISPCVHFTHDAQTYRFWPLHQSIMQDPGDPHVVSSGWISSPNIYRSKVEDADQLVTVECTFSVLDGNSYFTQEINVTSTAPSTLTSVNLITYIGIDVNGCFDDYAFIDLSHNRMLKACDNETDVWFGAYPSIGAHSFEVSEWNDGPYEGDDLWQRAASDGLDGATVSSGDVEGALKFSLDEIQPGDSKNLTIYYSFGMNEGDLYVPAVPGHDIAVTGVTSSKTVVGQGCSMLFNTTVENPGTYTETFTVATYANTTIINQTEVTLTSGSSTTVTFLWNTTGFGKGSYTISAYAWPVLGETDTGDNTLADGTVTIVHPGDLNNDGVVDIADVVMVTAIYRSKRGDPEYDPNSDIIYDGVIDIADVVSVTAHYRETDP